ncbi:MAG TPA: ABC transporter ATP-binding protein [Arenicellales bacterium]|nr:ABC transporter ATP-binding protein [Arenicellales bacterium]
MQRSGDVIGINRISKSFGTFEALSEFSLDVKQGEFITLLGPSGCGKTTLLKIISGFLAPTTGTISINGEDVTNVPAESRDTALCFQSYALFPHLSVLENLEFGLKQKKIQRDERNKRVEDVATKLGLNVQLDKLPNQLSGGQQQRVSLGRALVMRPSIILFDEPLSNLDAKLRDQVRVEIRRIQQDYGLTSIYVTHDQSEALAMSDRIAVLNSGKIVQVDTPEQLYASPRTRFVADFIGGANLMTGRIVEQNASGNASIETSLGPMQANKGAADFGSEVSLSWRPERAQVGAGPYMGKIVHRAFQGQFTDLLVEGNDLSFRIQTSDDIYRVGDTIQFSLNHDDVVLLEDEA